MLLPSIFELCYGSTCAHEVAIDLVLGAAEVFLSVEMMQALKRSEGELLDFTPLHGHDRVPAGVHPLAVPGFEIVKPQLSVSTTLSCDIN